MATKQLWKARGTWFLKALGIWTGLMAVVFPLLLYFILTVFPSLLIGSQETPIAMTGTVMTSPMYFVLLGFGTVALLARAILTKAEEI